MYSSIQMRVATVLTVYGIETVSHSQNNSSFANVATVLTVYGIETLTTTAVAPIANSALQQYLPFTVLKHYA